MKDKVVHDFSSQLGWSLETIESVDANHREMVRAPGIQQISEVLKSLSQEAKTSDTHFDPKFQDTQEYVPGPYTYTERFYVLDYHRGLSNIPQYHPGTCSWLLQDHRFKQWRVGTGSKIFWLHGHPGHGKSVFARYLVENLGPRRGFKNLLDTQSPEDPMMAFFLCSYRGEATTSTHSLLSSIIHQLLFEDPSLSVSFESKWKVIDKSVTESIWNLWKIISMIFSAIGSRTLFVVIDAIDELSRDQWAPFFENLKEIILSNHTDVRLVMTSRNEPDIEKKLLEMNVSHLDLGSAPSTRADILTFITDTVRTYGQQNSFSEQMTLHIIQELVARSDGMFLWARLAWQYFTDGVGSWTHGVLQIRLQDLRRLPPGMDVLYHRILMKVDKRLHAELLEVLKWILVSKRPLTIDEISIALALRDNPKKSGDIDARLSIRSFFLTHCPHLVKVANSGEITLIHQSFKDFLLQTKNINENEGQIRNVFHIDDPGEVEFRAGLDCLTYLGLEDFTSLKLSDLVSETYNYDFTANRNRLAVNVSSFAAAQRFKFLQYALSYWPGHLQGHDEHPVTIIYFMRTMVADSKRNKWFQKEPTLWYLWDWELKGLMANLVSQGFDINEPNTSHEVLLHSKTGSISSMDVKFLLNLGADINSRDRKGQTLLSRLVREGNVSALVEWLQRPGFTINARDENQQTALHAIITCPQDVIEPIIDKLLAVPGTDVNVEDRDGRTPLMLLMHWGVERGARKLLSYPQVNIGAAQISGESPLMSAAQQGWSDIALDLVQKLDAIDDYCDVSGATILHWAVFRSMKDVLEACLAKQPRIVNKADSRGMTPLHYAAQEGKIEAVDALLANGALVALRNKFGETSCHLAAASGHRRVFQMLLESGPSIILNQKDDEGWTVMHRALTSGNDGLIRLLLGDHKINLNIGDKFGRRPILFAAGYASVDIMKAFLEKLPQAVYTVDNFGYSLLHMAVSAGNLPNIAYLTSLDVLDKNSRNTWGKQPLDLVRACSLEEQLLWQGFEHSEKWLAEKEALREQIMQDIIDKQELGPPLLLAPIV